MMGRRRGPLFRTAPNASSAPRPAEPAGALTAIGVALYTWDLADDSIAWGPNAAEVLGLPHIGLLPDGASYAAATEPQGGFGRAEAILSGEEADEGDGVPYRARYAVRTKADRLVMVEDTGRWFADAEGRPALAHGTIRVERGLDAQDDLTASLKARAALLSQIADDVADAQRSRHAVTLVIGALDPDMPDADGAMADLARRLRPLLRRRDRLTPYAPNRFALALTSCASGEAPSAIDRLFRLVGDTFQGHLRLGAACAPDHAFDGPTLLRRAEEALAEAEEGFALYTARPAVAPVEPPGTSIYDVIDALNARGLLPASRPVLDAGTREPVFTALTPRLAERSHAGDIAAAAERAGLSLLVDTRMLELTADHLATHFLQRMALPVASTTLNDPEWLNALAAHLGARPGIESRLIVAVQETALRDAGLRGRLNAMKALGVGIMVTGFGTGHAGARELRNLPVDILQLDGALVGNCARSTDDRLLVHRLIDLAHHLGLATVAQGVADETTARLLAEWGVDCLEGPLCGRAELPARETERRQALAG